MDSVIVGAILAGLFGIIGIVIGVAITILAQNRQVRLARQQAILDDKRTRMRQYFATIYRVASTHMHNSARMSAVPIYSVLNHNPEYLVKRHMMIVDDVARATIEAEEVLAILTLEGDNQDIIDAYYDFNVTFIDFETQLDANNEPDNTELGVAFRKLRDVMMKKYSELDKVITKSRTPEILRSKFVSPGKQKIDADTKE